MTDSSTGHLVNVSSLNAASDVSFVGSDEHLALLQSNANDRPPGVRLRWADYSYSERSDDGPLIGIKHPSRYGEGSPEDRVRLAAAYLVHEIHHVLHSDHAALEAFERRTRIAARGTAGRQINPDRIIALCNEMEDRRLLELAITDDPDDVAYLEAVHRTGLDQSVRSYEATYGEAPWGLSPRDAGEQLSLALSALILLGQRYEVTDHNRRVLEKVEQHVAAGLAGTTSTVVDATDVIRSIVAKYSTR